MEYRHKSNGIANYKNLIAYIELALAMSFLGVNVVAGKFLVTSFPIFLLLGIRFLIGTLTFLPILYLQSRSLQITQQRYSSVKPNEWIILFLQAFFGALLFNLFMLYGLRYSTATAAGILTSTTPAFTTLLSFLFLAEKITNKKLFAIIAAIIGIAIINVSASGATALSWDILGNMLIILAVISGAFLTIFIKLISNRLTPSGMALVFNAFGFLLFLPFAIWDLLHYSYINHGFAVYALVILYSASGSILFPILWNRGISIVSASTASLFSGIMPISTAFLAYAFLGESLTLIQALGMCFVLFAIFLDVYKA